MVDPEVRDIWLSLGQARAWQAELEPDRTLDRRAEARNAYDRAGSLQPLKAEHLAARRLLD